MDKEQYNAFLEVCIKNIQKAQNENYLSIFTGAGISANSKLPKWEELMKDISKELYGKEEIKEDNLTLAEKFYNQFGENYYYQKLNEWIPNSAKPNELHKKIVKLKLKNLITTNWDNLFEQAINDEGRFYNIIAKDADIGYSTGFSKLIKMHGSLEDQNIVFKESDYLRYSDNFPLIENYIKGIFSTDLVVLMGYSLSDNNVKQIISWVNSKASNIKPIYFIKINKCFDKLEFDFYKNKNIYILYLDDEKYKNNKIESFLDNLLNQEQYVLKDINDQEINAKVEKFLGRYENCKFVLPNLLIRDFKNYFSLEIEDVGVGINCISVYNGKLISAIEEKSYKKMANLTKTLIHITNNKYIKPDYENIDNILYFDYDEIEKKIKELTSKDLDDEEELSLAFWLYQNEHYIESYNTLKRVSKNAFKNKDYSTWFISEINRENFVFKNVTEENEEEIRTYLKEMSEIDVDELYLSLPKKNRFEIKSIKELDSFIDKNLIKIYELNEKIAKDYDIYKNGGFSTNNNAYLLFHIFSKIFDMEIDLKLIKDLEYIYKNTIESLLIYYAYEGLKKEKEIKAIKKEEKEKNIPIDIDLFILSFAIKYFNNNDLKKVLKEYFKQNYIFHLNNEHIDKVYKNICKNFTTQGFRKTRYIKLFNNFLVFSSWIDLEQNTFNLIIEKFNEKLEYNLLGIPQYDAMNYFLSTQYYKNKNIDFSNISIIIERYINAFLKGNFGGYNTLALQHSNMFYKIFNILLNKKIKLNVSSNQKILDFITNLQDKNINDKYYFARYFLFGLAHIVSKDMQEKIDKFNLKIYDEVQKENKDLYTLELGYCLCNDKKIDKEKYKKAFYKIKKRAREEYEKDILNMKLNNLENIMQILDFIEKYENKLFGDKNE